jgi:3-(3-hydroxy-phenyl)propionate hydroxylase
VGWQIPQPWVAIGAGGTVRLDDLLGGEWSVLHTGAPPAGAQARAALGIPTIRISDPTLTRWLRRKKASAVVVRPDGFIYAATESGEPLPAPPAIHPQRIGVSA